LPVSEAVCPGAISSFFEICNTDATGQPLSDPALIGARGGGFAIKRGVQARVRTRKSSKNRIEVRINSKPAPEAHTTQWALAELLKKFGVIQEVHADITANVPISAGYGTSAAGTATSCLALAEATQLPVTVNELARITHIAEVVNRTGLGTASAVFVGGFVLVTEPGATGVGSVDRLLFPKGHSIICAYLGPMSTRETLLRADITTRVNPSARRAMRAIRERPELENFLMEANRFSLEAGFQTPEIKRLVDTMISSGAVGAAQNMIGKAVHGVAEDHKAHTVAKAVRRASPSATVFITRIDNSGARLQEKPRPKH
jgi:pantoate kinase